MAAGTVAISRVVIFTCGALLAFASPLSAQEAADLPTIKSWIHQLDADRFDEREEAAANLAKLGAAAIDPIVDSIAGASRERLSRSLSVLVNVSVKGEVAAQDRAEAAVESIAKGSDPRAARFASGSLELIHTAKREQAREILVALGAVIGEIRSEELSGNWRLDEDTGTVEVGPNFRGTLEDLKHLKRLTNVRSATLSLPTANDEWLSSIIEKMPQLREVNIKRAKVTGAGLAKLNELARLHHVWICYLAVDEKGAAELGRLPVVSYITLFGTGLTKKLENNLIAAQPNAKVDIRTGAFLGLGGSEGTLGFRVGSVAPGSAAEKAGIRVEDFLQTVNGQPVASIADLTRILRPVEAGKKVQIEFLSGSEAKKVEVTLGEWP